MAGSEACQAPCPSRVPVSPSIYHYYRAVFIQFVLLRIPIRGDTLDRTFFFSLINNMPLTLTVTRDSEGFIQSHAYA